MVDFLRERCFRHDPAPFVHPRRAFKIRLIRTPELRAISRCLEDVEDLPLAELEPEPQVSIPVLLRHYLRLGGKVAAFNVDAQFVNALDILLIVDLRTTPVRLLKRYLGNDSAATFRHAAQSTAGVTATQVE